jgi:hypothetical protein
MHSLITLLVPMLAVVSCGAEIWHVEARAIGSGPWGEGHVGGRPKQVGEATLPCGVLS